MERIDAVAAFVTRDGEREVLVFRHPIGSPDASPFEPPGPETTGVRLPLGTVEPGESAESGAVRAVRDLTGLVRVECLRKLGSISGASPGELVLTEPTQLGLPLGRGTAVEKVGERTEELEIAFFGERKWVPRHFVTTDVVRHLFHLRAPSTTPDRWSHTVDEWELDCYWAPLDEDPGLVRGHDRWLEMVRNELVS